MKKYPYVWSAVLVTLLCLFLVTILPAISQPKLRIIKDSGPMDLPEGYQVYLEAFTEEGTYPYIYTALATEDKATWNQADFQAIKQEGLSHFPIGHRPQSRLNIPLSNHQYFDYTINSTGLMTLYLHDYRAGKSQTGTYQLSTPHSLEWLMSYAQVQGKLYLLVMIQDDTSPEPSPYRLVVDMGTLEVTAEEKLDLPEEMLYSGYYGDWQGHWTPSYWTMHVVLDPDESSPRDEGPGHTALYLIDPVSLDYKVLSSQEGLEVKTSFLVQDQVYMAVYQDPGLDLVHYSLEEDKVITSYSIDQAQGPWTIKLGDNYMGVNYVDTGGQVQIQILDPVSFDLLYQGHIKIDMDMEEAFLEWMGLY